MRRFTSLDETTFLIGLNQELEDINWRLKNTQKTVLRVHNRSGGVLERGDVVVVSASYDMAVVTTTAKADPKVFGVVESGAADGGIVGVVTAGYVETIKVTNTDGVGRGEHLITSTTAGKAESSSLVMAGTFGIALTNADGGYLSGVVGRLDTGPKRAVGSFSAHKSVAQDNIKTNDFVKITFEEKEWDVSGWYSTSTSRYTPQIAGYYRLTAGVNAETDTEADKNHMLLFYKNGVQKRWVGRHLIPVVAPIQIAGSCLEYANGTTDYFEVYYRVGTAGDTVDIPAVQARTWYQGEFVGQ